MSSDPDPDPFPDHVSIVTVFTTFMHNSDPLKNMIQLNTLRTLSYLAPSVTTIIFTNDRYFLKKVVIALSKFFLQFFRLLL